MHETDNVELDELLNELELNKEAFYKFSNKNQQILLDLYTLQYQHQAMLHERTKSGWTLPDLKRGLQIVRKLHRQATEHLKQSPRSQIAGDLKGLKEYAIEAIHDLEDTQKEAIAHAASQPQEQTWGDIIGDFLGNIWKGLLWGIGIAAIIYLLFLILGPTHILPMAGNCRSSEGFFDCYWRIQAEKEHLNRFEECQRECGQGFGNELCLEQCEYTFEMGKWKYASTYTTSTGEKFDCPQGQEGYEDTQGRRYCQ